jgi:Tol biopolymer transport system component
MSSDRRFEQELPGLLEELYLGSMPSYREHILDQTARVRQRPAWSFVQRWLPLVDIARQSVLAARMPWRTIGLGFVLLALLIAMLAAIAVGTRSNPPAPFGPARTGLVAYSADGDIFTVDAITGDASAIISGPEIDSNPHWSLDGTRLVFERFAAADDRGRSLLYVTRADGSELTLITRDPLLGIESYAFSPDGTEVVISAGHDVIPVQPDRDPAILIAAADGSGIRQLDIPGVATNPAWRPPNGAEIAFMEDSVATLGSGTMFAVNTTSGEIRTILERDATHYRADPRWSPDGSEIAYIEWVDSPDLTARIHVMSADGTNDRLLPIPAGAMWQYGLAWSNDGTRLFATRGYTGGWEEARYVVVPADGSGFGVEIASQGFVDCCSPWEWAPDDSVILGARADAAERPMDQVIVDPVAGTLTTVPWNASSHPTWQRLAP